MDHDTGSFTSIGVKEFERWKNKTLRKDLRDMMPKPSDEGCGEGYSRWRVEGAKSDRRRVGADPLTVSLLESEVAGEGGDEAEDCSIGSSGVCIRNVTRPSTDARLKSGGGPSSPGTSGELCTRRRSEPFLHHCVIPAGGGVCASTSSCFGGGCGGVADWWLEVEEGEDGRDWKKYFTLSTIDLVRLGRQSSPDVMTSEGRSVASCAMSLRMGPATSIGLGNMEDAVEEHCEGGRGGSEMAVGLCVV